jgi:hypothetical protein
MNTLSPLENIKSIHSKCHKAIVFLKATSLDYFCSECNLECAAGGNFKIPLKPIFKR